MRNAVSLLCTDEAGRITGQVIAVDGGASLMDPGLPLTIQQPAVTAGAASVASRRARSSTEPASSRRETTHLDSLHDLPSRITPRLRPLR
jgi:hypothetical protein